MRVYFSLPAMIAFAILSACAAPTNANANANAGGAHRTLHVTGQGEARAQPDMARLSIGVQTAGKTAAEAIAANTAQMEKTLRALDEAGVAQKDIQTRTISINPEYDYQNDRSRPRITGYSASNTVHVALRDLDKAGAVLDQTITAGANALNGFSFDFADPTPLLDEARANAVADAARKAELYARAAGVSLGPVLQISDAAAPRQPRAPMMRAEAAFAADSRVPIAAGESTLRATVFMTYAIE